VLPLDLELDDPALKFVDLRRNRIDFNPESRGGFIDEIDGLVRKESIGDVSLDNVAAAMSAESWIRTP